MVYFTCNHCGESVKKPSVEKHYNFKCRGAHKSVSCMDCLKDFHGEEYVAHTRCITEAEKYSGKDYVPKEQKNSGQKKQESWMDIIRSILNTEEYNLSNATRGAFQKLQSVDNVPRKKAKFQNFVANCMRMRHDQAEEVWCILEKELEKMKASKAEANAAAKKPVVAADVEKVIEKPEDKPVVEEKPKSIGDEVETKRVKKSKSKKRKVDKEIQNTIEEDEEEEILQMVKEEVEKGQVGIAVERSSKKKSKKSTSAEQEPTISTTTPDEFQWALVIVYTVKKYGNSMKLDKLKRKIERMYLTKRGLAALTEKQQSKFDKKFGKYVKKCHLKIENDIVKLG